ncbi:MAG TPA: hypothetical protein VFQ61_07940 [Polyangiaceae bacterium]|nr:hypothetical protein [Polyangiaceae bacterium]
MRAPRFWLTPGPALSGAFNGALSVPSQSPILVELLPTGRVRPADAIDRASEAELPEASRGKAEGRGLALYVQAQTELHYDSPDGLVFGRLHPGALVRVTIEGEGAFLGTAPRVKVGANSRSLGIWGHTAFADRAALSTHVRALSAYQPVTGTEVLRAPLHAWGSPPERPEPMYYVSFSSCYDLFARRSERRLWQYVAGIETFGRDDEGNLDAFDSVIERSVLPCRARSVSSAAGQLLWHRPELEPQIVSTIPAGYEPIALPDAGSELLLDRVRRGHGELYWIVGRLGKLFCSGWRFSPFRGPREARVEVEVPRDAADAVTTGQLVLQTSMDGKRLSYPVEYVPSTQHQPAQLWLGSPRLGGHPYFKCSCENNYVVLKAFESEVWVSNKELPDDAVAFDPDDKERWFFSRRACEVALGEVQQQLQRDPNSATRLGIHARSNSIPH